MGFQGKKHPYPVYRVECALLRGVCDRKPPSGDFPGNGEGEAVLFPGAAFGCDCPLPVSVCVLVSASADSPGGIGSLAVCRAEIFLERAAFPGSRLWGSVGGSGFSLAE